MIQKIGDVVKYVAGALYSLIAFLGSSLTEPDTGKASFGRIAGSYVIYHIVKIAIVNKDAVSPSLMELFYWLVGYSLLSKLSIPALEIVKLMFKKADIPLPAISEPEAKP